MREGRQGGSAFPVSAVLVLVAMVLVGVAVRDSLWLVLGAVAIGLVSAALIVRFIVARRS